MTQPSLADLAQRIILGPLLGLAVLLLALALPVAVVLGRRAYLQEAGSAASCLLNAISGGPRTITYSAWAWQRYLQRKRGAAARVWLVDRLMMTPGHCSLAWASHHARGLL